MPIDLHPISDEQLMSYLDGELPPAEASIVANHLGSCRDCQALAGNLQGVARLMHGWSISEPGVGLRLPAVPSKGAALPIGWRATLLAWLRRRPAVSILAALAALMVLLVPLVERNNGPLPATATLAQPELAAQLVTKQDGALDQVSRDELAQARIADSTMPMRRELQKIAPRSAGRPSEPQSLVVRKAQLTLETERFDFIRQQMEQIAEKYQGYLESMSATSSDGQTHSLEGLLRIPATQLNHVLGDLRKLGRVVSESQQTEDVTRNAVDMNARLTNLRETEQRLKELLRERTGKLSDVLAVEEQINSVRGQIEVQEAEQRSLNGRVALASLQFSVSEVYKQRIDANSGFALRFRNAAVKGYQAAVNLVTGILIFLLAYGPVLLLLSPLAFWAYWRWKRISLAKKNGAV